MKRIRLTVPKNHLEAKCCVVDEAGNEVCVLPVTVAYFTIVAGDQPPQLHLSIPIGAWTADVEAALKDALVEIVG